MASWWPHGCFPSLPRLPENWGSKTQSNPRQRRQGARAAAVTGNHKPLSGSVPPSGFPGSTATSKGTVISSLRVPPVSAEPPGPRAQDAELLTFAFPSCFLPSPVLLLIRRVGCFCISIGILNSQNEYTDKKQT